MSGTVIGVTGPPCAGKSTAAELLASGTVDGVHCELCKADDIGHEALLRPDVAARLRERFGAEAFSDPRPAAVRRAIAARVFASPDDLAWLERLVHPLVAETIADVAARAVRPVIIEAALLFTGGLDVMCRRIVVVEAGFETRLRRAAARGWDRAELEKREARQRPLFAAAFAGPARNKLVFVRNDADLDSLAAGLRSALGTLEA